MNYLTINHLKRSFDELGTIKDISLAVEEGKVMSTIRPSGSGKSTLLQCATILEQMDNGEIIYLGERAVWTGEGGNVVHTKKKRMRGIQSYYGPVLQNFNLFPHYSMMKNITDAPIRVQKRKKENVHREMEELSRKAGLEDKEHAYPYQLPGGQYQRMAIARALALNPKVLFLDEPTSALDPEFAGEVLKIIRSLTDIYITMVIVTHEMALVGDILDRMIFMADGVIVEKGCPKEVFVSTNERMKGLLGRYGDML